MDDSIAALETAHGMQPHPAATETAFSPPHTKAGAWTASSRGSRCAAIPDLERAVELSPDDAGMLLNLAAVLAEAGDRARARTSPSSSLALRPGYEKAEALLRALK